MKYFFPSKIAFPTTERGGGKLPNPIQRARDLNIIDTALVYILYILYTLHAVNTGARIIITLAILYVPTICKWHGGDLNP